MGILTFIQDIIPQSLIIHETIHGLVVLPFVFLIWYKTKSIKLAMVVFITAYLVDVDHLVDYFAYKGFEFKLADFMSEEYYTVTRRAYAPLHGWEWIVALLVLGGGKLKGWQSFCTALGLGLLAHLLYDSWNVGSIPFYSFIYRAFSGFGGF